MSLAFDSADSPRRSRHPAGPSWLHSFSATFAAALLAGVVLLLGVRVYIHWSINDALGKLKEQPPAQVR